MTADSSNSTITYSGEDGGSGVSSPSGRTTLLFSWTQVVNGGIESNSISHPPVSESVERNHVASDPVTAVNSPAPVETQSEESDVTENTNAGGLPKSAWSKPLANRVMEETSFPVMDASSWPALSETTRPGVKLSSVSTESSFKPANDGLAAVSQAPAISQPPLKQLKTNSNHIRQRATRHGGSTGGAFVNYNGPPPPPPLPPPFPLFDIYGNLVTTVTAFPQPSFKTNNWSPLSSNKNPARRNNFGPRPVNIRHGPPGPPVRGFVRPPFIPHQFLTPHVAPMSYEMGASYVYVPIPLVPHGAILRQIEYYFSDENLVKDNFLRSHMDDEGWVPITLIAGFQRVKKLTNDLQMILNSLTYSNTIEIQGEKVRRRTGWRRWIHVPREEALFKKLNLEDGPTTSELMGSEVKLLGF